MPNTKNGTVPFHRPSCAHNRLQAAGEPVIDWDDLDKKQKRAAQGYGAVYYQEGHGPRGVRSSFVRHRRRVA